MSVALTINTDVTNGFLQTWEDTKRFHALVTFTFSGNYVGGGDTVSFNNPLIKSNSVPCMVNINGQSKYLYGWVPGTTISNGKIKIFVPNTGVEFSGAYGSDITGDVVVAHCIFPKHI